MDTTTLVILGVIVLAVLLILVLMATRSRVRRPELKALAPEARDRYAAQWDRIETHFVDSPGDAVREADALALALLGEREHPLVEEKLPANMRKARRLSAGHDGKGGTEGMRQGMLMYRSVIEEYGGPRIDRETPPEGRREIAS